MLRNYHEALSTELDFALPVMHVANDVALGEEEAQARGSGLIWFLPLGVVCLMPCCRRGVLLF